MSTGIVSLPYVTRVMFTSILSEKLKTLTQKRPTCSIDFVCLDYQASGRSADVTFQFYRIGTLENIAQTKKTTKPKLRDIIKTQSQTSYRAYTLRIEFETDCTLLLQKNRNFSNIGKVLLGLQDIWLFAGLRRSCRAG